MVLTDSGTTALTLALAGARGRAGGEVALPAYGCFDLATAAVGAEAPVRFYDLDPVTLGPDMEALDRAVRAGARTVVIAHYYGLPVDLDRVRRLLEGREVVLVEDAAQGEGGSYGGRPLGSHGTLSVLSFGRGKGRTGGSGGALLANDPRGVEIVEEMEGRLESEGPGLGPVGVGLAQWLMARPGVYWIPASLPFLHLGETRYRPPAASRAMAPAAAALLAGNWEASDRASRARRSRARRLLESVDPLASVDTFEPVEGARPGYLRLPLRAGTSAAAEEVRSVEARRLGVAPPYPRPLHRLPPLRRLAAADSRTHPGAELLCRSLFTLPTHGRTSSGDAGRLRRWLGRLDG